MSKPVFGRSARIALLTLMFREAFTSGPWRKGTEADELIRQLEEVLDLEYKQGMVDGSEIAIKAIRETLRNAN